MSATLEIPGFPAVKRRERLPVSRLSDEESRLLYSRYSAAKNKATTRGLDFPWPRFADYLETVLELAPSDYLPSTYRISYGEGYDFSPGKMKFSRKGGGEPPQSHVIAEMTRLLLTQDGDLDELAREAQISAIA